MLAKKRRWILRTVLVMLLVLVTTAFGSLVPDVPTSHADPDVEVALSGAGVLHSSPAAADFDGDGDKEIVIGGQDGMLYVIAYDGLSWSVAWSRQTADDLNAAGAPTGSPCVSNQSDIRSSPAIADLDNDGSLEIVVSTGGDPGNHRNGGILVYRYEGNSPWLFSAASGWPQPKIDQVGGGGGASDQDGCWDGIWSTPALGDLDGDGDLEVVVEGFDRRLHAWHHDGTVVDGWPIYRYDEEGNENRDCLLRGGWSSPALGDIDGDGLPEVVVGTDSPPWNCPRNWEQVNYKYATVWAINGDSSNVPGWPVTTDNNIQSSPALGDIDGDGQLEVVVGSGNSNQDGLGGDGRKVYAWNGDGSLVDGWPRSTAGDVIASPALGDLDGDGDLEIVVGCGSEAGAGNPPWSSCTKLYAWHGDGGSVTGFPMQPQTNPGGSTGRMPYGPILADYDGDGDVEILVTHFGSRGIATVERNGTSNNDPDLVAGTFLYSSPLVDDVDGDGELEIVIGSLTFVYIWDVGGDADGDLPWPMFHHNVRRTGALHNISGRVVDVHRTPFAGVTVSAGAGLDDVTDANGDYQFNNLGDRTFVLTPTLAGYAFSPPTRAVTLPPSATRQDFVILAGPVSKILTSDTTTPLVYTDTQGLPTRLDFATDTVSGTVTLILTPTLASAEAGFVFAGHAFELVAYKEGVLQEGFTFDKPVTVTIRYGGDDVRMVTDENELLLKWWTGSGWQDAAETCTPTSVYTHDMDNQKVSVAICHLSRFALFGPAHQVYLPIVLRNY